MLALLSCILWRAVAWALLPGFWTGEWLHSTDDTPLTLAKKGFGPILLVKDYISDPDGKWGEKFQVLREWGHFETAARLKLIIALLWVAICFGTLLPKLKRNSSSQLTDLSRFSLAVTLTALFATGCATHVERRKLLRSNPTSYSFPMSVEGMDSKLPEAFSHETQDERPIFPRLPGFGGSLDIQESTNSSGLQNSEKHYDFLLTGGTSDPLLLSPVYRGAEGGLPFLASFRISLLGDNKNTMLSVMAFDTKVVVRTGMGFGPCGPGQGTKRKKVKPTTIEEYTVLKYAAASFGYTNLPPVLRPATNR